MNFFYHPNIEENETVVTFEKDESRHISKVLRKNVGDILNITDGKGFFYQAEITLATDKKCNAKILTSEKQQPLPYSLHLAVAPTKLNDRFEWFLEKATEIGISEITPIICDHSERKVVKIDRYEKIIIGAMKQSMKAYLPKLNEAISFSEFIEKQSEDNLDFRKFIAHCEETSKKSLKHEIKIGSSILILIGPEGDFSSKEISSAIKNKFIPVSLGETRLRTETAAIVACHSVAFANE